MRGGHHRKQLSPWFHPANAGIWCDVSHANLATGVKKPAAKAKPKAKAAPTQGGNS